MKKFLSLVVAALLSVSAITTASAANFTDVDVNNDALTDAVELLTALNVTKGTTETTFGTTENVTRQQMAAFIYRMMKAGKSVEGGVNTSSFTDLDDPTFYFMVSWADSQGIIKGRNATTFDPKGGIILQDAYTMIVRALGYDDGTLSYPIGFISKAEDLGLDEDLPSAVTYTTTLTRGDVAILLANMFYAETAETEIRYEAGYKFVCNVCKTDDKYDHTSCGGQLQAVSTGQVPKEFHKTIAEEIFEVQKISQRVVATPNYAFGANEMPDEDVEMITLKWTDVDDYAKEKEAWPTNINTIEFEDLGLEGKADDYFLSDILMFVRKNSDGETEIFGATAQGTKKTVSFDKVEFGTVSGTTDEKYYDPENKEYKHINGKVTLDGTVAYLFGAPYSFTKDSTNLDKYNAKFIKLGKYEGDMESEDETDHVKFRYVYDADKNYALEGKDAYGNAIRGNNDDETKELKAKALREIIGYTDVNNPVATEFGYEYAWTYTTLSQLYFGGLGEIDVYDCNGDGKPDYLFVKNFTTGTIETEEEMSVADTDVKADVDAEDTLIYTDMTIVDGEAKDKDVVLAYVDKAANYVKIIEVLTAKEATVTSATEDYLVLSTGEKIFFEHKNQIVANAEANLKGINSGIADTYFTKDATYYFTADGRLVYAPETGATATNLNENYTIVINDKVSNTTQLVDGKLETANYVEIYNDGEKKAVKAKKVIAGSTTADDDTPVTFANNVFDYSKYLNKLAVAKADKNGAYYFNLIDFAGDPSKGVVYNDYTLLADEKNETAEYRITGDTGVNFYQYRNNIYTITIKDGKEKNVNIRDYTQIIIKAYDDDGEAFWTAYGADNLPDIDDSIEFTEVSYIIVNNLASSKTENLAVFYGEVANNNGELKPSKGKMDEIRVVKSYSTVSTDEGKSYIYELFNPFTGKLETGIECADVLTTKYDRGDIVALTTTGLIDDKAGVAGNAFAADTSSVTYSIYDTENDFEDYAKSASNKLGFVYLAEYEEETGAIYIAETETKNEYTENGKEKVEYILSNAIENGTYQITDKTVVTFSDKSDATIKTVDASVLGSTAKTYKQSEDNKRNLRVFLAIEEAEDSEKNDKFYDVVFAMIVRD